MGSIASSLVKAGGNALEKYGIKSVAKAIGKSSETQVLDSGPAAAQFWGLLKKGQQDAVQRASPVLDELHSVLSPLSDTQWLGAKAEQETGNIVSHVAAISKAKKADIWQEFVQRGLVDPKRYQSNYYPRMAKPGMFEGRSKDDAIAHLIKTGQVANYAEGDNALRYITSGGQKFSNIEKRRTLNLPDVFWRDDRAVDYDYIHRGYKRLAEADNYGPKDENLLAALSRIKAEQGQAAYEFAKFTGEHEIGRRIGAQGSLPDMTRGEGERAISSLMALTKLSFAGIKELGQGVTNIPIVTSGFSPLIRGIAHVASNYGDARDLLVKTGGVYYQALHVARAEAMNEALSLSNIGGKMLQYTFAPANKLNRLVAASAGKFAAEDYFEQLLKNPDSAKAKHMLGILGVDFRTALTTGKLSEHDILTAAKRVTDMSLFTQDYASVPPAWKANAFARTVTMYKSFGFQQAKLIKNMVIKPALGIGQPVDLKPLAFMSILFPTVGEVINDAVEMARKGHLDDRPDWEQYPFDRILDNAIGVGALGLLYDMTRSMAYNDRSAAWRFFAGPALGDVMDIGTDLVRSFDPSKPHPFDNMTESMKKRLTRSVPLAGPRLYEEYFAKRGTERYKTFFKQGGVTKLTDDLVN